jgi:hypothetical protein
MVKTAGGGHVVTKNGGKQAWQKWREESLTKKAGKEQTYPAAPLYISVYLEGDL